LSDVTGFGIRVHGKEGERRRRAKNPIKRYSYGIPIIIPKDKRNSQANLDPAGFTIESPKT